MSENIAISHSKYFNMMEHKQGFVHGVKNHISPQVLFAIMSMGLNGKFTIKCFDKIRFPFPNEAIKVKRAVKKSSTAPVPSIDNPTKKIVFDNTHHMTIIELYVLDRDKYQDVIMYPGKYPVKIAKNVKQFLKSSQKVIGRLGDEEAVTFLTKKWNGKTKKKWLKTDEEEKWFMDIVNRTKDGRLRWKEEQRIITLTSVNSRYSLEVEGRKFIYTIIGYKKDGEMKLRPELVLATQEKRKTYPSVYNKALYEPIIRNAIRKEIKKESYIKKRLSGESIPEKHIGAKDFLVRTNLFRCFHNEPVSFT